LSDNYAKIIQNNLDRLFHNVPENLTQALPAKKKGNSFEFEAFGEICEIGTEGITLNGEKQSAAVGILISLYALHACSEPCIPEPFKAFKDFSDSMPYTGAFSTHTEHILVPHTREIRNALPVIMEKLRGMKVSPSLGGDFSFAVYPLPKIALCYIFYEADEDFPASVTCLFSNNALRFLPIDGLADTGEYTSRKIIAILDAKFVVPPSGGLSLQSDH